MKKLVIVQNKPTQFDVPFYAMAAAKRVFGLHVFYSDVHQDPVDPEIGRAPVWDNLVPDSYPSTILTPRQVSAPVQVCKLILEEKPDLVILCGYSPLLHAKLSWLLKSKGVRIGLRSDNTLQHSRFEGGKGLVKRLLLPLWLRRYDTWHPVGTLAGEYLKRIAGAKRPVHYFPYSADNDWFAVQAERHSEHRCDIRKQMGIHDKDFVVLGIMKWNEREDPLTLINGIKQVVKTGKPVRLILLGDGPLRREIKEAAAEMGDSIFMPGFLPYSHLPKYYAVSDVFVHPAVGEPWGVSVNEAMACGVPVVAAEGVGAGRDLIISGKTGYTFPNGDSRALAEVLHKLHSGKEKIRAMGEAARHQVKKWGYDRTMNEMINALEG